MVDDEGADGELGGHWVRGDDISIDQICKLTHAPVDLSSNVGACHDVLEGFFTYERNPRELINHERVAADVPQAKISGLEIVHDLQRTEQTLTDTYTTGSEQSTLTNTYTTGN